MVQDDFITALLRSGAVMSSVRSDDEHLKYKVNTMNIGHADRLWMGEFVDFHPDVDYCTYGGPLDYNAIFRVPITWGRRTWKQVSDNINQSAPEEIYEFLGLEVMQNENKT